MNEFGLYPVKSTFFEIRIILKNQHKINTLIIGASSKLSDQYVKKYGVDRSNFYGISSKVQGVLRTPNITIYDYSNASQLNKVNFDEILILASRLPSENINLKSFQDVNKNVLSVLTNIVIPNSFNVNITFISSYSVYNPLESYIDENSATYSDNDYAYSKLEMENSLIKLATGHGINLMIMRMPVLLYKGVNTNFLGKLVNAINNNETVNLSNPSASLSLVFDVENIIRVVESEWKGINLINCSSVADITFTDIAELAKKYGLSRLEWIQSDRPSQRVGSSKLCTIIGELPSAQKIVKNWFKEEFPY